MARTHDIIALAQGDFPLPPQHGLAWNGSGEIKGQQIVHTTAGVGEVLPEWVWLRLNALRSGAMLTNLMEFMDTR